MKMSVHITEYNFVLISEISNASTHKNSYIKVLMFWDLYAN